MSQLTPTHVEATNYAEHYILYGDQSKAFRHTFSDSQGKPETIHSSASKFHTKVLPRIEELRTEIQINAKKNALYSIDHKREILFETALYGMSEEDNKQRNPSATVAAIKELNSMDGHHAPTKREVAGDLVIEIVHYANDLSKNSLPKLAD
jgi:hypothetical protein